MIAKLLPVILALVGLGAGMGAGLALRPAPEASVAETDTEGGDPAATAASADPAAPGGAESSGETGFVEMSRQFVIPVIGEDRIDALVVASLSVEVTSGAESRVGTRQPKLRDRFLRVMLDHANTGGFDGPFTANGSMDRLRRALVESGSEVLGRDLVDVLILGLNRQDA